MLAFIKGVGVVGASVVVATAGGAARADVTSAFGAGAEGWRVAGPNPAGHIQFDPPTIAAPWVSDQGNPPGSLRVEDVYGWTWVAAPAPYLGDKSGSYGGEVSFDILITTTDGVEYPAVALRGASITLYFPHPSPPVNQWTRIVAPLTPEAWRVDQYPSSAPVATEAQLRAVLADLRDLYLLTEWNTGTDLTFVDNVRLTTGGPACPADYNRDGVVTTADITAYLAAWFASRAAGDAVADFDGDVAVGTSDITAFLSAWFAARSGGC